MRSTNTELEVRYNGDEILGKKIDEGQIKDYNYDFPHFKLLPFSYDDISVLEHIFK